MAYKSIVKLQDNFMMKKIQRSAILFIFLLPTIAGFSQDPATIDLEDEDLRKQQKRLYKDVDKITPHIQSGIFSMGNESMIQDFLFFQIKNKQPLLSGRFRKVDDGDYVFFAVFHLIEALHCISKNLEIQLSFQT